VVPLSKGKINRSKAAVSLGWHGKPVMEKSWNQLRHGERATNSETSSQNNLAMTWGNMCAKSAMATNISIIFCFNNWNFLTNDGK